MLNTFNLHDLAIILNTTRDKVHNWVAGSTSISSHYYVYRPTSKIYTGYSGTIPTTPNSNYTQVVINIPNLFSIVKKQAAEAGYNLVIGSFEEGGTLTNTNDVLWYQANGKYYNWYDGSAKTVVAGSTPSSTGGVSSTAWVDRADLTLRAELADTASTVSIAGVAAKDLAHKNGDENNTFAVASPVTKNDAVNKNTSDNYIYKSEVIAHRGFAGLYPENTMAAYNNALHNGATAVETDISISSDGYRVLCHDATVDRTSNGTGTITSLSFAYLRTLDFGSSFNARFAGERIPELSELLNLCKHYGVKCYPELKNLRSTADIDLVVSDIYAAGMESTTVVQSFYLSHLTYLRNIDATIPIGWLVSSVPSDSDLDTLAGYGNAYLLAPYSIVNSTLVSKCKSRGLDIAVWTVDTNKIRQDMKYLGINKWMSNYTLGGTL